MNYSHQESNTSSNTKKNLSEPSCLSAFVAKKSSHQVSKDPSSTKKNLREPSCLSAFVAKKISHQDSKAPSNTMKLSESSRLSALVATKIYILEAK